MLPETALEVGDNFTLVFSDFLFDDGRSVCSQGSGMNCIAALFAIDFNTNYISNNFARRLNYCLLWRFYPIFVFGK